MIKQRSVLLVFLSLGTLAFIEINNERFDELSNKYSLLTNIFSNKLSHTKNIYHLIVLTNYYMEN